jgi:hypothetical protein
MAREDDAERAVRAGLDLVATAAVIGEELAIDGLQMRVGITTGQVAVTLGAVGEGLVAGDAVNTAARVQSVAMPGQVWVDDTTRSLTTASLAYTSTGKHEMKGKTLPVELFHALRTTAVMGGAQRVDGLEAPFVGRERELRQVKEMFHVTAEERRPRLVLVAGEPGIGKTRLAWEFEKYADAITETTHWLRGRCLSYGQGVAGRVVADMVRSLLRVTDNDDHVTVTQALDERLARHVADEQERSVLRPRLMSLLGLSDAVFDQADLFACWRAFFESLCADGSSLTLIVEDLQWADDGFFDFLDHLLDTSNEPIMVVALARPAVTERRLGIGAGRRSSTVFLEPLTDRAMGSLLDGLVADLPDVLRAELVARAEGVPLYAVETVRALIDRDVVVPLDGQYVVDPVAVGALDLSALGPPASLQALLAARLDALPAAERRVVQDASVLGLSFTRAGIGSLTPHGVDLEGVLESLRRKEIFIVDNDPRSPERGQYRFVQALLRAGAYDTLSRRDRYARHLAVARHLAALPDADGIAGVIAAHYLDALAAMPDAPDEASIRDHAAELLEHAASHAVGVGAPRDALAYYARVLGLDLGDQAAVRLTIAASGLAMYVASDVEAAQRWVLRGLEAAERCGDEEAVLSLTLNRARLLAVKGLTAESQKFAQLVFEASIGRPDRVDLLANSARTIAVNAQGESDTEVPQQAVMRALADVERHGDDRQFDILLDAFGMWSTLAGYRRLSRLIRQAVADRDDERDPRSPARLLNLVASLVHDDPVDAARVAGRGLQRSEELGQAGSRVAAGSHLAVSLLIMGRWDDAAEILHKLERDGRTDRVDWETYRAAAAALLAYGRGDPTELVAAVGDAEHATDPIVRAWWWMREAVVDWLAGDRASGSAKAMQAVEEMMVIDLGNDDLPFAYSLAVDMMLDAGDLLGLQRLTASVEVITVGQRFRALLGHLLRSQAQLSEDPEPGLRDALEVFTAMGAGYPAARVAVELAAAVAEKGDHAAAAELLATARPLLERIGAAPVLAQTDRLAAVHPLSGASQPGG